MTHAAFEPSPVWPAHIRGQTNRKQAIRADLRRDLAPDLVPDLVPDHNRDSPGSQQSFDLTDGQKRSLCEASHVLGARLVPSPPRLWKREVEKEWWDGKTGKSGAQAEKRDGGVMVKG